jgi:2,5-diamino-6-hydroxy-4-(5-phosphoribosylamino)pyrimidine 1'-reductase
MCAAGILRDFLGLPCTIECLNTKRGTKMRGIHVIVGGFMSLDGKIAPANRVGREFSKYMTPEHERLLFEIRAGVDAIIVGVDTVIADNPSLTLRSIQGKNPLRVVLDSHARTPLDSKILNTQEAPTLIAVAKDAPKDKTDLLKTRNVDIMVSSTIEKVDLNHVIVELINRGVKRVLVEGGGEVRWSFFEQKLVDEVFVWVMPTIWGGRNAPTLVEGEGFLRAEDAVNLELESIKQAEDFLVLWFTVRR